MSDAQIAEFYERVRKGRMSPVTFEYPFHRGFNAGIDFCIKQMKLACDEPVEDAKPER
jgi:hypothetical protein